MRFSLEIQATILVSAFAALAMARPQHSEQPVFRAYSPGQYDGQQVIRSSPRLVAVRPAGSGSQVLRAVPAGAVKRVRVVPAQAVSHYNSEEQQIGLGQQQQLVQPAAYYVQRAPIQQSKPAQIIKGSPARPAYQSSEEAEEEYASDPNPQYNFSFDVKDDELTNYQNRQEERDGGVIKGSYSVVDPDGYVRTVTYTADSKNGFQAKVVREPTDVKIKFPVPTQSPDEQPSLYRAKPAAPVRYSQPQPQYQLQQQPAYYSQASYPNGAQPTYVVRRVPAGAASEDYPRVVRPFRQ